MNTRKTLLPLVIIFSSLFLSSCLDVAISNLDPEKYPDNVQNNNGPVSFSDDLVPRLNSGCSCHANNTSPTNFGGLNVSDHASVTGNIMGESTSRVNLSTPSDSYFLTFPTNQINNGSGDPHQAQTGMSTGDSLYQDVLSWISDGALNN